MRINEFFCIFSLVHTTALATFTLSGSLSYAVENHDFMLSCESSVVAPAVLWIRNDTNVAAAYLDSKVCKSADTGANLSSNFRYNCTDNKTFNLIIPGDRILQEDGSKWQCKDAGGGVSSNVYMISVSKSPTSDPVVTGYSGIVLYPGDTITLTCTVQGGTPLAKLSWTCGGNSVTETNKGTSTTAINEVMLSINSSYNGQTCVCKAEHLLWTTDKTAESQRFVVYYPPTSDLIISGYNGSILYVNKTIVLTCQLTGGYPIATMSWSCDGQDYNGTNRSSALTSINELTITMIKTLNGKSCICKARHQVPGYMKDFSSLPFLVYYASSESPVMTGYVSGQPVYKSNKQLTCKVSGGYPLTILSMICNNRVIIGTNQSTSTESKYIYNININKTYNKQQCICNGRHPDQVIGYNRNTTVTFNVYFSPDTDPVVTGYTYNQIIYETENKDLTCYVNGGNPLATITWTCRGVPVSANNQSVEGKARSTITLDIGREYNNKQCICEAEHPADNYNRQTSVTFTVYYPPTLPVIKNTSAFPWLEGRDGSLLCESSPGNPSSSYQWKVNEKWLNDKASRIINFTGLTKDFNRRNYSCEVYNNYTSHTNKHLWSQDITLNVEYLPVISIGKTPAYVNESDEFTRQCTADGNPTPSKKWKYGDPKSSWLHFVNTNRNQTGNYTCEAIGKSSKYGELKSKKDLTVIVQYPPSVTVFLSTPLEEGKSTYLACTARGVPDKYFYTGWTQMYGGIVIRRGLNFGSLNSENSRLTLRDLSYQDIGVYICTVHNAIKDRNGVLEQYGSAYLDVKFPPAFIDERQIKVYAELDHGLDIEIQFFSNPCLDNTSIAIIRADRKKSHLGKNRYSLTIKPADFNLTFYGRKVNVNGQKAVIVIHSLQKDDTGNYNVIFTTPDGFSSNYRIDVLLSQPPNQPRNFSILNKTGTTITVAWISGFNGGLPQTFVILYISVNSKEIPMQVKMNEKEQQQNYDYRLKNLDPGTEYIIWIYSVNKKGNSLFFKYPFIPLRSMTKPLQMDNQLNTGNIGSIIGGVICFIFGIICVVTVLFAIKRWRNCNDEKTSKEGNATTRTDANYEDLNEVVNGNINGEMHSEGLFILRMFH